jgi:hypothetical protein
LLASIETCGLCFAGLLTDRRTISPAKGIIRSDEESRVAARFDDCGAGAVRQRHGIGFTIPADRILSSSVLLANWPYTIVVMMPTNRRLMNMPPGAAPAETRGMIGRWGILHAARCALGLAVILLPFVFESRLASGDVRNMILP